MILVLDGLKSEKANAGLLHEIQIFISLSSGLMASWSSQSSYYLIQRCKDFLT